MTKSVDQNDDLVLGKKEYSTEPAGFDLLRAANSLGFSDGEIAELKRLYRKAESRKDEQ